MFETCQTIEDFEIESDKWELFGKLPRQTEFEYRGRHCVKVTSDLSWSFDQRSYVLVPMLERVEIV